MCFPSKTDSWATSPTPGGDELRVEMQAAAKDAGVFAPHAPVEYGGHGLSMSDRAPVFEEAGYSLFGPIALNLGAPDEGNVHMLAHIASAAQKEQFLAPLARGDVRSAFAMTEPAPGAGSDPAALTTAAERVEGGWKINGHKCSSPARRRRLLHHHGPHLGRAR